MNKIKALLLLLVFPVIIMGAKGIEANLDNVKIFLRGAELNHSANIVFDKGDNEVVITGIADNLDINSLSVKGLGNFVIKESKIIRNYLGDKIKSERIEALEDSIEILKYKVEELRFLEDVERSQLDLLLANKNIGGESGGPSVQELKKMTEFFKSEMKKINYNILSLKKEQEKVIVEKKKYEDQLNEVIAGNRKSSNDLVVNIEGKIAGKGKITVSYFTGQAGWKAGYDVRAKDIKSPLSIMQKGLVWQNTGVDWKNINVILSTGNPSYSSYIPEFNPWRLDFLPEPQKTMLNARMEKKAGRGDVMALAKAPQPTIVEEELAVAEGMADYTSVQEGQISSEFVTDLKYSIPSDRKEHVVTIKEYELTAEYQYYAAPKLSEDVFLAATMKDWGDLVLIPGKTNVFFENSFVGSSYLNPGETDNEIKLSLGRDKSVSIHWDLLKDYSEDKFLSSDVERKFTYKITLRNNKKTEIDVMLEDQYPLTNQEDIEVELLTSDGAKINKEEGKLTWQMKAAGNEVVEKTFSYKVRYPGDRKIMGL